MKNPMRYIPLLFLCSILAACKVDTNWLLQSEELLTIQTHEIHGRSRGKKEIRKGDETYSRFKRWMEENERGWKPSPVTYVPDVEVRGKKFVINFLPGGAILNFQSPDGNWHQYVKDIAEADFQYLLSK